MDTSSGSITGDHCPPLLTYGIELEFLVQFVLQDDGKDIHNPQSLPPATRLPQALVTELSQFRPSSESWKSKVSSYLQTQIRQALRNARVPVEPDVYPPALKSEYSRPLEDLPTRRFLRYRKWVVKGDDTVRKPPADGYGYAGIEVTTPCLDGTKASFRMVRYVVNLIASKFRVTVNETCGLHVHVGRAGGFDLGNIRRIMGSLYASDRLLATLHPPIRRFNRWGPSIREKSELAKGRTRQDFRKPTDGCEPHCHDFIGREVRFGEESLLWRQINNRPEVREAFMKTRRRDCYEPFQWDKPGGIDAYPPLTPGQLSHDAGHIIDQTDGSADRNTKGDDANRNIDDSGMKILLDEPRTPKSPGPLGPWSTPNSPPTPGSSISDGDDVSKMSESSSYGPRKLPCVAIRTFTPGEETQLRIQGQALDEDNKPLHDKAEKDLGTFHGLVEILWAPSSCVIERLLMSAERPNYSIEKYSCHVISHPDEISSTIEFREAAGSVDAAWVTAWARICHGVATWAVNVSWCEYMDVVTRCDEGEFNYRRYDVIDFLGEIGLVTESKAAEKRIEENMSAWGLKFMV